MTPLLWLVFSAAGTVGALPFPVHLFLTGLAFALGWLEGPRDEVLHRLVTHPLTGLYLRPHLLAALPLGPSRFRYTLYDGLPLKYRTELIAVLCYGTALLGTAMPAYLRWTLASPATTEVHDGGREMSSYLIVMHQTALSPNLQRTVRALVAEDPTAEFAVLVPETLGVPLTWEGETVDVARQRAEAAKTLLEETAHARVFRTAVGAPEPLQAIADELQTQPGYDILVICTSPPGVSRWLKLDLMHRAERKFGLRVIHVVAEAAAPARP